MLTLVDGDSHAIKNHQREPPHGDPRQWLYRREPVSRFMQLCSADYSWSSLRLRRLNHAPNPNSRAATARLRGTEFTPVRAKELGIFG